MIEGVNFNSLVSLKVHGALYHLSTVDFASLWEIHGLCVPLKQKQVIHSPEINGPWMFN